MTPEQKSRYARHIQLPQIGEAGQHRLLAAKALIIGLGGLGSPIAMYLAAAGVGELTLVDYDRVELSNLQRQIVHHTGSINENKVDSARQALAALNPGVRVRTVPTSLDGDDLIEEVERTDVVVDACDNFESRFALNAACVRTGTPLVSGAAVRMEGQVCVFEPAKPQSPCYRCLYPDNSVAGEPCSLVGVLAPLLGVIGSVQATETLKLLCGMGTSMTGRLLLLDAARMEWHNLRLKRSTKCPVCAHRKWS
ncbi:MAG: molybdopterin-synthase adenylyltransferase MoeB [Gammaproteobacteria bacterium]|nr:molybdopterin-synthase adenylyltransferase MoeB [Gammaproteobacteria bacterium]